MPYFKIKVMSSNSNIKDKEGAMVSCSIRQETLTYSSMENSYGKSFSKCSGLGMKMELSGRELTQHR